MQELGAAVQEREYSRKPLTADEIREIAGDRSVLELINPARPGYTERGFDRNPPDEAAALQAMAHDNNLIHRPIAILGGRMVKGIDEDGLRELVALQG